MITSERVDRAAHEPRCEVCGTPLCGEQRRYRFCSIAHKHLGICRPPWERFLALFDAPDGLACWSWIGARLKGGYGRFTLPGHKTVLAHRFAYEAMVGPIPAGLHIDHLCRNRSCVNPAHLEPVTPRENTLRGNTLPARNAARSSCPFGHPYDLQTPRQRVCLTCRRLSDKRRRLAKRMEAVA